MTQTGFIDFLGLTFPGSRDEAAMLLWAGEFVRQVFGNGQVLKDTERGWSGYRRRFDIEGVGLLALGGNGDTIHFEVTGTGCAQVRDWEDLRQTVEEYNGRITRADVASDDFDGKRYNLQWCRGQYEAGGFDPSRGARPQAKLIDDMGTGAGCTLYVGSRESGKLFRGYEKGKKEDAEQKAWFRLEVEYRAVHREIPLQILVMPGAYLAGAYPCLADCDIEQQQIKTFAYSAAACIKKAVDHAKQQAGRAVHALLVLNGGDIKNAIDIIHVPELPKRLIGQVRGLLSARERYPIEADMTRLLTPQAARAFM
jgi:phage replication initiation protein